MFYDDGVVTKEMFEKLLPSKERRERGKYVVMECFQKIPCNPCSTNCKFNAINMPDNINEIPQPIEDKCVGCGKCVSICPGQAAFVIDETYSEKEFLIKIPYEMIVIPKKGEVVDALDRKGKIVAEAQVIDVQSGDNLDKTNVITIAVSKEFLYDVRSIKVKEEHYE